MKEKDITETRLFLTALLFMFIGFKIAGIITWSWVWVLSPMLIPLAIVCVLLILKAILIAIENWKG